MKSKLYDVVVVGGGPIGSRVAGLLSKEGVRVLIIERKPYVGFPNHCSGMVSRNFVELINLPQELILNHIKGGEVYSFRNNTFFFKREEDFAVVIDRVGLDIHLHKEAIKNGSHITFNSKILSYKRENNLITLLVGTPSGKISITSKIVVVATGANDSVKKLFGFIDNNRNIYTIQVEDNLRVRDPEIVYIYLNDKISHNWFSWIIPLSESRAKIGLGTDKPINLVSLMKDLMSNWEVLKDKNLNLYNHVIWKIPTGYIKESVKDNIVLVGDTARQVKPFSGGGLYTGMFSAHFLCQTIIESLKSKDYSKKQLLKYEKIWKKVVGKEIKRELFLRKIYIALSDEDKDRLIRKMRGSIYSFTIKRYGFIDEPWRAGFRLIFLMGIIFTYIKRKLALLLGRGKDR